jgi:hypothetical protein
MTGALRPFPGVTCPECQPPRPDPAGALVRRRATASPVVARGHPVAAPVRPGGRPKTAIAVAALGIGDPPRVILARVMLEGAILAGAMLAGAMLAGVMLDAATEARAAPRVPPTADHRAPVGVDPHRGAVPRRVLAVATVTTRRPTVPGGRRDWRGISGVALRGPRPRVGATTRDEHLARR